jgi:hypothetical protein
VGTRKEAGGAVVRAAIEIGVVSGRIRHRVPYATVSTSCTPHSRVVIVYSTQECGHCVPYATVSSSCTPHNRIVILYSVQDRPPHVHLGAPWFVCELSV